MVVLGDFSSYTSTIALLDGWEVVDVVSVCQMPFPKWLQSLVFGIHCYA